MSVELLIKAIEFIRTLYVLDYEDEDELKAFMSNIVAKDNEHYSYDKITVSIHYNN